MKKAKNLAQGKILGNTTGNTIDINGKRYDAVTGKFLGASTASAPAAHQKAGSIDGFRRSARSMDIAVRTTAAVAKPATKKAPHAPAPHIKPHQPQKGTTLMRTAVKKPEIVAPSRIKAMTRTDVLARVPQQTVTPKLSQSSVSPKRLKKATLSSQSPAVSRYAAAPHLPASPKQYYDFQAGAVQPGHNGGLPQQRSAPTVAHIPVSPPVNHSADSKKADIFEQAIASATSHENTYTDTKAKKRSRWAGAATFTMAILLLASIVGYMNMPLLSMKLAASRAGIDAKLPGYSPAGFSYGSLSYGPGNVTVSYTAGADSDRKFDITQKVSEWDSQALLTNFVASANKAYQTYERAGRTIYFYGDNTATWVDGGIWYTVNGNNSLSKNQLLDMAGSL